MEPELQPPNPVTPGALAGSWSTSQPPGGSLTRSHCSAWSLLCRPRTMTSAFIGVIFSLCSFFRTCFSL